MSDTELEHRAAVIALLTSADARPLTLDEAADLAKDEDPDGARLPTSYTEVYVTERQHVGYKRAGNGVNARGWRVQIRAVATLEENAITMRTRACRALEDKTVIVGGVESTPMQRGATDDPIGPDNDWFSGLSELTYYL